METGNRLIFFFFFKVMQEARTPACVEDSIITVVADIIREHGFW